ncbi:MAG TPA: FtsX-like permease family protein [Flavisolibacter sp.]|jgi:putative ABC transport system permease protein|nr:FtsX-like permease family protein [Flavisolibacter sp.]
MQKRGLNPSWLVRMAWRDSRKNRSRLFLFIASIVVGIAALVAIDSLSHNLRREIDLQAAELLGADLEISNRRPYTEEQIQLIDSLGGRRSEERRFTSMIFFPKNSGTRIIEVRALGGEFPYYGELNTEPATAGKSFRNGRQALVDQTLMLQFGARVGDSVRIGRTTFLIAGVLKGAPGQSGVSASVAPVVYIPLATLPQTGLEQKGSRINYRYYIKWDQPVDMQAVEKRIEEPFELEGINWDTVESQKEDTSRSFRDVIRFLSLVAFIALLLGCIGVASAIQIYIREKISTIAVLRCLGATATQAFFIYLIQIIAIGFIGSLIGAILGTLVQQALPVVLKDLLPVAVSATISWPSILQGIVMGVVIAVLFALLPLVSIRKISPLNTLRISFQQSSTLKDPLKWLVYMLLFLFVVVFAYLQVEGLRQAIVFTTGVVVSFLVLSGIAALLMWVVRKFFPVSWSFLFRQGVANLYRPNNQTRILIVSIGLGTALICTLFFIQGILLNRVSLAATDQQPNMVLFDIQSAQRDSLVSLARQQGLPADGTVPIVTMRLEAINQITPATLRQDSTLKMQRWVFSREYRVTFRDSLISSEKLKKGKWTGHVQEGDPIFVSLEEGFAERNSIAIGDTMHFNVQGVVMPTIVGSLRSVDWNRMQTNFLVVFPSGVLEEAPQFHVLLTRVPSVEASARFQQAVVRQFPNISIIDLGLVLSILNDIMDKIGFVIRFMAAFSILTGLIVLIASVLISKYQRMQENVLLRTLGAQSRQVFIITALEYFILGAMAAATGIFLAVISSWALAEYMFETTFTPQILPVVIVFFTICFVTVAIGLFNSRSALSRPPLEILRQEV